MGFLDKPKRYLPLKEEITICDVCGSETLKLIPCSHWKCSNCGYDTRISDFKLSGLKREYKEIRELNQKAREKQWELRKEKWVKCIDCKYSEPPTKNYFIDHVKEDCYTPTYLDNSNREYGCNKREKVICCSFGIKKKKKSKKLQPWHGRNAEDSFRQDMENRKALARISVELQDNQR